MTCAKKRTGKLFSMVFTLALLCLLTAAIIPIVNGASAVDLGTAGNYVILTKTGITTTGTTTITGDMGVSPIDSTAITGFGLVRDPSNRFSTSSLVTGKIYAANYRSPTPSILTTAVSDMEAAYTSAAGQVPPNATGLYEGNLGGKTLPPGLYKWSTGVLIPTSTALTLDAQGNSNAVWVFQVAQDFTMDHASRISLINGAKAENVYWQIGGLTGVTINTGAHAEGNILAAKAIRMKAGASLHGRALAQTAVTLIANTITAPVATSGLGVFRPSTHTFDLKTGSSHTTIDWGLSGDGPVTGDWNGDGRWDVGVYRSSIHRFFLKNGTANTTVNMGMSGDSPVTGDWNGDGLWDVGVYRNSTQTFYLKNGTATTIFKMGKSWDIPVSGDWNGDGLWDVGVYRPSTHWFYLKNGTAITGVRWGQSGDIPVTGDWNGDGLYSIGIFRPSTHTFLLRDGSKLRVLDWGESGDIPVSGKWG